MPFSTELGLFALVTVFVLVVSTSVAQLLHHLLASPLRHIPGPRLAAVTELWRTEKYFQGHWMQDIIALHHQYGPVVRLSPNEVSITDHSAIRGVYGFDPAYQKSSWYDTWRYAGSTESVFATRDVAVHQFLRKRVSKLYSMSSLLAMEDLIDNVLDTSLDQLRLRAKKFAKIKLDDWTMFFAYEVVSILALGHTTGFLERGEDVNKIIRSNQQGFWLNANVGYLPGQSRWFANYWFLWLMTKLGIDFEAISLWIDGAIAERRRTYQARGERQDFLGYFLSMKDMSGGSASDEEVASEVGNVLGAGADTTAISLMATLKYLIEHPEDYRRVQQEVDEEHRRLDLGIDREVPYAELSKLPFLSAVIKEALRLHPAIAYQLPRVSTTAGTTIGSHHIPAGVDISMSAAAVNRSRETFGPGADSWKPERWLGAESQMLDGCVMTFGRGSRGCLGKNLALLEIYKYIGSFVRNFDVDSVGHEEKIRSYWFATIEGKSVRLIDRML